ncbi:MAG: DNA mismatch repair protein MutL, partial [Oscillospiraceae bacterium]
LLDFGFEVDDFGTNSVLVRAVPCDIVVSDIQGLVVELAEKLATNTRKPLSDKTQWVLSSIACRAAVKAGETTKPEELLYIAKQIIDGDIPAFCPHGRPVLLRLTKKELEKQFGRLG